MDDTGMIERVAAAVREVLSRSHRFSDNGNGSVLVEGDVDPAEMGVM